MTWTEERIARLKALREQGFSAHMIALDLGGVTRSAVLGKVHRLGLPTHHTLVKKPYAGSKPKPKPRPRVSPKPKKPPRPRPELLPVPEPLMLDLVDLTPRTCRWPIGDPKLDGFGFCGHDTVSDSPYCRAHHQMSLRDWFLWGEYRGEKLEAAE